MTPADQRRLRRILEGAKTLLKEYGWIQGAFKEYDKHCLVGALIGQIPDCNVSVVALAIPCEREALAVAVLSPVAEVLAGGELDLSTSGSRYWLTDTLTEWNDNSGTEVDDVFAVLDAALERIPDTEEVQA